MKEIMLIVIGAGAGFAICGCLMFYVMAKVSQANGANKKYNEETVALLRERNRIDETKVDTLRVIAEKLSR